MAPIALLAIVMGFIPLTYDATSPRLLPPPQSRPVRPVPDGSRADAGVGQCSTDFVVRDGAGHPVADATVRMHIRYGLLGLRRIDLAVGTGGDGHARIQGLPDSASLLRYEIGAGRIAAQVTQDLSRQCRGRYDVTLR